jgi:hypothetical protein
MDSNSKPLPAKINDLPGTVQQIVFDTPVLDIHTHLYPPEFTQLALWGIDELVNYHYLIAETFRSSPVKPSQFWAMSKSEQADLIWKTLFVENTPVSEACRGVVKVLSTFGLDPNVTSLKDARAFFGSRSASEHVCDVLARANVSDVVMTNDIFDKAEASLWMESPADHPKFHAVLRMDPVLNNWQKAHKVISEQGYPAELDLNPGTVKAVREFLDAWIARLKPLYLAVSLPPTFAYPDSSARTHMLNEVVLPTCRAHNLPFATMIGVRKQANPALRDAGDAVGHSNIQAVEHLCLENPDNKFLVTMLSRENQHELCVSTRKFSNLMLFGCWWFLNNPSIVSEITDERIEMLGASFIPQHSDARILDQLIYKWDHSRRWITDSLVRAYSALIRDGWKLTPDQIRRDVQRMFQDNFRQFVGLPAYDPEKIRASR